MRTTYVLVGLVFALVLAGCNSGSTLPDNTLNSTVDIQVDPALTPPVATLPALGGSPRPVAVLEDEDGSRATFVANELWLATDDRASLDALLVRWNATILLELDPAAEGVGALPHQYLVRIDPTLADTSGLPDNLQVLDSQSNGNATVSSQAALGLIAASAAEALAGHDVAINWVGIGAELTTLSVRDRIIDEAPTGATLGGVAYTANPFAWPTHDVGSPQDIGVAEAWRALDLAGRLIPGSVDVAILDMGFEPDSDTPGDITAISNVPLILPTGTQNLLDCGGPCPWHGTNVMSAAFAVPGNSFGSAGPGGPVAKPILIFTSYDFFTSVSALLEARSFGAKVANMSYSTPVPNYLAFSVLPFEAATTALRASGMLIFASAGNDGKNVDAEQTAGGVGLGFEKTWHTPCENGGVICVGGLFTNSLARASGSNFGTKQVDIFAPFTLWVGPDPDSPNNEAQVKNGTSFSSPFAAGVAALIWAADMSQGASDVENILFESAKSSSDDKVGLVIDALAAVQLALGNVPPAVDVIRPSPGDEIHLNETVFFDAIVNDFEDGVGCCDVTWTSNLDGQLGTGTGTSNSFASIGARVVSVVAVDSEGGRTTVEIPITVVNDPPTVEITKPLPGDDIFQGVSTVLRATSFDFNEANAKLACGDMNWTSSNTNDAGFPVTGCAIETTFTTLGGRTITLTGTDPQGARDSDTVDVTVTTPPPDLPPSVLITSPDNFQSVQTGEEITLSGNVSDPEGDTPLTLTWTITVNGGTPEQVGTGNNVLWTPADTIDFSDEDTYDVTVRLTAQDPGGNTGNDFVQLRFIIIN